MYSYSVNWRGYVLLRDQDRGMDMEIVAYFNVLYRRICGNADESHKIQDMRFLASI
jgi:hypothetical protein